MTSMKGGESSETVTAVVAPVITVIAIIAALMGLLVYYRLGTQRVTHQTHMHQAGLIWLEAPSVLNAEKWNVTMHSSQHNYPVASFRWWYTVLYLCHCGWYTFRRWEPHFSFNSLFCQLVMMTLPALFINNNLLISSPQS